MSIEIYDDIQHWGLPKVIWRSTRKLCNRQFDPPFRVDNPEWCLLGQNYWKNYTCQPYQYQFNDWGFRDQNNFEQYRKEVYPDKVNIAIGDSFTINIGGSQEHAWPQLLSNKLQVPVLNVSVDNLPSYYFLSIANKCKQLFNVDKIFVLYNLFDDVDKTTLLKQSNTSVDIYNRATFLKKHCWIFDAYWQFTPPWTIDSDQLIQLYNCFPQAHDYLKNTKIDSCSIDIKYLLNCDDLRLNYYKISGASWISYEKFCESLLIGETVMQYFNNNVDQNLINTFLSKHFFPTVQKILLANRDGYHMSLLSNGLLADYFYQQTLIT